MHRAELDRDFELALEVIFEDLKNESNKKLNRGTSNCSPPYSTQYRFVDLPVSECSPGYCLSQDVADNHEEPASDECPLSIYEGHLGPNRIYNDWENNLDKIQVSFWDANDRHGWDTASQCCSEIKTMFPDTPCEVPDITNQMEMVQLAESDLKQDTTKDPLHVNFLNLKSLYNFSNDLSPENQKENLVESEVYIFLKSSLRICHIKVYLLQNDQPDNHKDPFELQARFDQHKGLLIVDLHLLSSWRVHEHAEYQLCVVTQLEVGNSHCIFSSPFKVEASSSSYGQDETISCFQQNDFQVDILDDEGVPCTPPLPQQPRCEESMGIERKTIAAQKPEIQLLSGSKLNVTNIHLEFDEDEDIVLIEEQSNFAGLLKLVKRNPYQNPLGRRRANGFRSAEEIFSWVCGHCFFKRPKKSTVRSHVSRKVCFKTRRFCSEKHFQVHNRPVVRQRSNTFPTVHGRNSSYDDMYMFTSKTP